ncbi:hypothetical protein B0H16DRAFT_1452420 [Mycena metata]|uniref:Uncharacterized protein n=1 Tax=Mycena metata TaxID=1033252 RepID=A0AAD7JT92_9AGAR|nr:hypothetical protein B0H16DRAFT_1452420 [Mycena metata]
MSIEIGPLISGRFHGCIPVHRFTAELVLEGNGCVGRCDVDCGSVICLTQRFVQQRFLEDLFLRWGLAFRTSHSRIAFYTCAKVLLRNAKANPRRDARGWDGMGWDSGGGAKKKRGELGGGESLYSARYPTYVRAVGVIEMTRVGNGEIRQDGSVVRSYNKGISSVRVVTRWGRIGWGWNGVGWDWWNLAEYEKNQMSMMG